MKRPGQIRLGLGLGITAATLLGGLLMPAEPHDTVRLHFPIEAKQSSQVDR